MQSQKLDSQRQPVCFKQASLPVQSWVWAGLGMGAIVPALVSQSPLALAASLSSWHYDTSANQLVLTVKDNTNPHYFLIAQPARIVVDLPDTAIANSGGQKTYTGAVRSIRVSQFQKGSTRIVMELSPDISLAPGQVKLEKTGTTSGGTRWVLQPLIASPATNRPQTPKATSTQVPASPQTTLPKPAREKPSTTPFVSLVAKPPSNNLPTNFTNLKPLPSPSPVSAAKQTPPPKPISPSALLPDTGMVMDTSGAVPITVPPPEKIPDSKAASAPVTSTRGTATPTPLSVPTLPATPPSSSTSKGPGESFPEIPSTIAQAPPSTTPTITVPPLSNPGAEIVAPEGSSPFPPAPGATHSPDAPVVVPSLLATVPTPPNLPKRSPASPAPTAPPLDFDSGGLPSAPDFPPPRGFSAPGNSAGAAAVSVPPLQPMSSPVLVPPSSPAAPVLSGAAAVNVPPLRSMPTSPVLVLPPENSETPQVPVSPQDSHIVDFGQPLPTTPKEVPFSKNIIGVPNSSVFANRSSSADVLLTAGTTLELRYPGTNPLKLEADRSTQEVLLLQSDIHDRSGRLVAPAGTLVVGRFETTPGGSRFVAQAIRLGGRNVRLFAQSDSLGGSRQPSNPESATIQPEQTIQVRLSQDLHR